MIDRRPYLKAGRDRGDSRQHDRGVLVICLATLGAIKTVLLSKLSELRNCVHRQLRAGIEFDIDLHESRCVNLAQTSAVTAWQVGFKNRYFFSFFHMSDESILILDFIHWIGRHFRTLGRNFGADEEELMTV